MGFGRSILFEGDLLTVKRIYGQDEAQTGESSIPRITEDSAIFLSSSGTRGQHQRILLYDGQLSAPSSSSVKALSRACD